MTSNLRFGLILFISILLVVGNAADCMSGAPRNNNISTLADALKYLQDLERYYGDKARVRFGKRASLVQILHNRIMDGTDMNHVAEFPPAEESF